MTEYGFTAINSDSEIQIDSVYKNFSLLQIGAKSLTGGSASYTLSTPTEFPPLVATKPATNGFSVIKRYSKSGANYSAIIVGGEENISQTVNLAVFGGGSSTTLPDYGIAIYNGSGDLVYNSGESYLKIIGTYEFTVADPRTSGTQVRDITVSDAINNYFILAPLNRMKNTVDYAPFNPGEWSVGIKRISTVGIRVSTFVLVSPVSAGSDGSAWNDNHVLIEVTF